MKKKELLKRIEALEAKMVVEKKTELEIGKWYKATSCQYLAQVIEVLDSNVNYALVNGFDGNGNWAEEWDSVINIDCTEATHQEVEEALITEAKKRYKVGDKLRDVNDVDIVPNGDYVFKDGVLYYGGATVMKDGKWAEIVEEKQYTPKIGDVVRAWEFKDRRDLVIGRIGRILCNKNMLYPYLIGTSWYSKIEPITDENIIKLFN